MLQRQKNTIEIIKNQNDGYEVRLRELPGFDINGDVTSISMKKFDAYQTIVKAAEFIQLKEYKKADQLLKAVCITDKVIMGNFILFFCLLESSSNPDFMDNRIKVNIHRDSKTDNKIRQFFSKIKSINKNIKM